MEENSRESMAEAKVGNKGRLRRLCVNEWFSHMSDIRRATTREDKKTLMKNMPEQRGPETIVEALTWHDKMIAEDHDLLDDLAKQVGALSALMLLAGPKLLGSLSVTDRTVAEHIIRRLEQGQKGLLTIDVVPTTHGEHSAKHEPLKT
jgi:hypothetical protein